jgi:hypothetical protein
LASVSADRDGLCNRLRARLVSLQHDTSTQGDDAFIAILARRDILEAGLIKRRADGAGNVG